MINKIEIDNFRLFKHFEMNGIKQINLIVGENNVGKSSLLEAILMYSDKTIQIFSSRMRSEEKKLVSLNGIQFQNLFHKLDYSTPITITLNGQPKNNFYIEATNQLSFLDKYEQNVKYLKEILKTDELCELFSQVANDDEKLALVIKYLGNIEPRLKDLRLGFNGLPYIIADIGIGKKIILNNLGDGINKLLGILLTMLLNENLILLIDEIENGFHYSFYPKLWEMLSKVAKETDCQIFATTHSYECTEGAKELNNNEPDLFGFIRLDRDKENNIVPKMFSQSMFNTFLENGWEVR